MPFGTCVRWPNFSRTRCARASGLVSNYDNSRTRNWEQITTLIRAIGYVAA